jgi:hypothetical protein
MTRATSASKKLMTSSPALLRRFRSLLVCAALAFASLTLSACSSQPATAEESWSQLRKQAAKSDEHDLVAEWLLAEMLRPGGNHEKAKKARAHLDDIEAVGIRAHLARALDDLAHGKSRAAVEDFFAALVAARDSDDPNASLYAWFAATRAEQLSGISQDFGKRHRKEIAALLEKPGRMGFRAYASAVELWADDAFSEAVDDVDDKLARKLGCVENLSLAGPFGTDATTDILRSFPAERAGVWYAAVQASEALNVSKIVCFTETGNTVRLLSRYRPNAEIIALTPHARTVNHMTILAHVRPFLFRREKSLEDMLYMASEMLVVRGMAQYGDAIFFVAGVPAGVARSTNVMKIHQIGEEVKLH